MLIVAAEEERLVPCPGGELRDSNGEPAVKALSWDTVQEIIEEFETLHPYDRNVVRGSLLEIEEENYVDGELVELQCCAISAKRYALFRRHGDEIEIVWASEHGRHLLNPLDPEDDSNDWTKEIWRYLIKDALGIDAEEPAWLDRMAVSRLQVSTPDILEALETGDGYKHNYKPASFLIAAHVRYLGHPDGVDPLQFHLVAPFERDPRQWLDMEWTNKYSGETYRVATTGEPTATTARVRSFRDVLRSYATHAETKSCGPDGQPCDRATVGLLQRRPVRVLLIHEIGKEANKLEELEAGHIKELDEVLEQYDDRRELWEQLKPVLAQWDRAEAAEAMGITKRQVRNLLNSDGVPSEASLLRLREGYNAVN